MKRMIFIFSILLGFPTFLVAQQKNNIKSINKTFKSCMLKENILETTKCDFLTKESFFFTKDSSLVNNKSKEFKYTFTRADSAYLNSLRFHKFGTNMNLPSKVDLSFKLPRQQKYYFSYFNSGDMPDMNMIKNSEYPFNVNYKDLRYFPSGDTRYRGAYNTRNIDNNNPPCLIYIVRKNNKLVDVEVRDIKR